MLPVLFWQQMNINVTNMTKGCVKLHKNCFYGLCCHSHEYHYHFNCL